MKKMARDNSIFKKLNIGTNMEIITFFNVETINVLSPLMSYNLFNFIIEFTI